MSAPEYLFPRRLDRRHFLQMTGTAAAVAGLSSRGLAAAPEAAEGQPAADKKPVQIGQGQWTYTLDDAWGKLPAGMKYGFGCGIAIDGQNRIFVTSRSPDPCVAIFATDGKLLETWSKDFADKVGYTTKQVADTAHGLYWSKEDGHEYLYFTENAPGCRVYKTDMQGKILYTLGKVDKEGDAAQKFKFDNPTDVAVAPNGDIYVVDGYGSQLVHRFDKNFKLIRTIGGHGKEHGKFETCHGVWVNTLKKEPEVYIADRANNRLEIYSLALDYKRTIPEMRLPCCFYQHEGHIYVPELGARVTILDADDKIVAQLGDGKGIDQNKIGEHPDKFATPHALTVDSKGNFYVLEWLPYARVRKFAHTPA
ncbi:MAG TPA: 6-bladed beta-propeller [Pirellulales bacterium]|jgi:hypothetical protein|nr:6-bladed beta-propeller [Pirellulales bacterium]